jgi:hypothetical protein
MPYSYSLFKTEIKTFLYQRYLKHIRILDVGPGCGTYSDLLRNRFKNIDAVEIFAPNIDKFNLAQKYVKIYHGDVCDFEHFHNYTLVIMGDILEHLTIENAQALLKRITCDVLVAVPYTLPQGPVGGNDHETHIQDDLTHEIVMERYKDLKLLMNDEQYGYYLRCKKERP